MVVTHVGVKGITGEFRGFDAWPRHSRIRVVLLFFTSNPFTMPEVSIIQQTLIDHLKSHIGPLQVGKEDEGVFEVKGTIPTMQGRQKVDGFYFASVMPKAKDCRLYFFPIYTHPEAFADLGEDVRKCLKGKSCFHIKHLNDGLDERLKAMIDRGISVYQEAGLLEGHR